MYILKIKGKARIPDYIQLRDNKFTLVSYFRLDRLDKGITQAGLERNKENIIKIIRNLPFGKMHKIEL